MFPDDGYAARKMLAKSFQVERPVISGLRHSAFARTGHRGGNYHLFRRSKQSMVSSKTGYPRRNYRMWGVSAAALPVVRTAAAAAGQCRCAACAWALPTPDIAHV